MQEQTRQRNTTTFRRIAQETGLSLLVFFATLVLYLWLKPHVATRGVGVIAQGFILVTASVILIVIAYLYRAKRLTTPKTIALLTCLALVLRIGYVLYTAGSVRQHDTVSINEDGHEAYAWILFTTGKLPKSNVYQFYHPPLNAMVQATFMHFIQWLTNLLCLGEYFPKAFSYGCPYYMDFSRFFLFSCCQILGVLYSYWICRIQIKTVELFRFKDKTKLLLVAIVLFFPRGIQMTGMLNNDLLAYLLASFGLYASLKWYREQKLSWLIVCAFSIGLGMMTKLSCATVCFPIAGVFIYRFVCVCKTKDWKKIAILVGKYALFLAICAPIGLWFQVYAKVRFDQPFGYVFDNLNPNLLTTDHSWFSRFVITTDLSEYLGSVYCRPFDNYNLFHYALRSAIFGEFYYATGEAYAFISVLFAYAAILTMVGAGMRCLLLTLKNRKVERAEKRDGKEIGFLVLLLLSQVGSLIYFYIKMPYGCTMDFRYIMPIILGLALSVGMLGERLEENGDNCSIVIARSMHIAVVGFLVTSCLFYCVCA